MKRSERPILMAGAMIGAVLGALGALVYLRWGAALLDRQSSQSASSAPAQPVKFKQVAQVGMLGFQLIRELSQLIQRHG